MSSGSVVPRIESNDLSLMDLFKDFYTVPDFQREYVWEPGHVEKLLTDVFDEFYDEENRLIKGPEYFLGSVVGCADEEGTYQLIDGQQRLTTIYLVICAVRDLMREAGESEGEATAGLIRSVSADPETMATISRYRLDLQYDDSRGALEKIANADIPVDRVELETESIRHLVNAYMTIREFFRVQFQDDLAKVNAFLGAFLHRVKIIRVLTPNLAHALKVFETINDRGIGLNPMDLLKNLLFMKATPDQYTKLKSIWKDLSDELDRAKEKPLRFLRYYIMSHHMINVQRGLREDEIYDWFTANSSECGIDSRPLEFAKHLRECSKAYGLFLKGKNVSGEAVPYLSNIAALAGGSVRQHLILALAGRHLETELFTLLCRNLENLFFCYLITREPTKNFERNFARWSSELRDVKTRGQLDAFIELHFYRDMASRSARVAFALDELDQSKIQQYRLKYILAKLTQHVDQQAWDNPSYDSLDQYLQSSVHVEHILPQTPRPGVRETFDKPDEYDIYMQRLGNLMLLEKTINSSIGNDAFSVKKNGYAESGFLLTKSLVRSPEVGKDTALNRAVKDLLQFENWDSETIEARQKMLKLLAWQTWMADVGVELPETEIELESLASQIGMDDVVMLFNETSASKLQASGKGKTWRIIRPSSWPWAIHYEFLQKSDYIAVEIHLEDDNVRFLEPTLRKYEHTNLGTGQTPLIWDPSWSGGRGRLTAQLFPPTDVQTVAQAMNELIELTYANLTQELKEAGLIKE